MKQKTKLLFAIMDTAPILLLDEPTSNLDANAIQWYQDMIEKWAKHKTIIVFSNSQKQEYLFCQKEINLNEFLS
jgi:ABC-type multidrug transport system ATPase subunit